MLRIALDWMDIEVELLETDPTLRGSSTYFRVSLAGSGGRWVQVLESDTHAEALLELSRLMSPETYLQE